MIILKVQKDQSELKKDMDLNSNMIILKEIIWYNINILNINLNSNMILLKVFTNNFLKWWN